MAHWAGAGATATGANAGYRITAKSGVDKYNVYPMLFVGDASFTTIGFQTDGKTVKFKIVHKKPSETVDRTGHH
jgi:N4-gp56 family major capsid protein